MQIIDNHIYYSCSIIISNNLYMKKINWYTYEEVITELITHAKLNHSVIFGTQEVTAIELLKAITDWIYHWTFVANLLPSKI